MRDLLRDKTRVMVNGKSVFMWEWEGQFREFDQRVCLAKAWRGNPLSPRALASAARRETLLSPCFVSVVVSLLYGFSLFPPGFFIRYGYCQTLFLTISTLFQIYCFYRKMYFQAQKKKNEPFNFVTTKLLYPVNKSSSSLGRSSGMQGKIIVSFLYNFIYKHINRCL